MAALLLAWSAIALAVNADTRAPAPPFTVLFFTAPWCGPCRAVHRILDPYARKKVIEVVEVDFDRAKQEVERWGVEQIPVVIVLSDRGRLLLRADGASPETLRALDSGLSELVSKPRKRSPS